MRGCPYCAEQIQDAAIVCRFCGRDVEPVRASQAPPPNRSRLGIPSQRWYELSERVRAKQVTERPAPTSIWAKLGGALQVLEPRELRPNRSNQRQTMIREYATLRAYQGDVARLTAAGWTIEQQKDNGVSVDLRRAMTGVESNGGLRSFFGTHRSYERILVTWIRDPQSPPEAKPSRR